jgi:threonine dehydrogenase-like Zn-dependent dehydrogenase
VWTYRLEAPREIRRVEVPDDSSPLAPGDLRVRVTIAGICGSDMPRYLGTFGQFERTFSPGDAPLHEVLGVVSESASARLPVGTRIVGTLLPTAALSEYVTLHESRCIPVPDELDDVEGIIIQPLSTVLRAVGQFPPIAGKRAVLFGVGPAGLAICHVLKHGGVTHLTAVDPIERADVARTYGADAFVATTSTDFAAGLDRSARPEIVVEAVGHQQVTMVDGIATAADGGYVFGFGAPDDVEYRLPYLEIYLRDLTIASGRTIDGWPENLQRAATYLLEHRADFAGYVSHVVPLAEAERAYELYATPQPGRLKVVIATEA